MYANLGHLAGLAETGFFQKLHRIHNLGGRGLLHMTLLPFMPIWTECPMLDGIVNERSSDVDHQIKQYPFLFDNQKFAKESQSSIRCWGKNVLSLVGGP